MPKIYREITFGLRLIMTQLDIIRNYYNLVIFVKMNIIYINKSVIYKIILK